MRAPCSQAFLVKLTPEITWGVILIVLTMVGLIVWTCSDQTDQADVAICGCGCGCEPDGDWHWSQQPWCPCVAQCCPCVVDTPGLTTREVNDLI